ncbi:hypothetical protein HK405_013709, partial [Cladochytrium tenue]
MPLQPPTPAAAAAAAAAAKTALAVASAADTRAADSIGDGSSRPSLRRDASVSPSGFFLATNHHNSYNSGNNNSEKDNAASDTAAFSTTSPLSATSTSPPSGKSPATTSPATTAFIPSPTSTNPGASASSTPTAGRPSAQSSSSRSNSSDMSIDADARKKDGGGAGAGAGILGSIFIGNSGSAGALPKRRRTTTWAAVAAMVLLAAVVGPGLLLMWLSGGTGGGVLQRHHAATGGELGSGAAAAEAAAAAAGLLEPVGGDARHARPRRVGGHGRVDLGPAHDVVEDSEVAERIGAAGLAQRRRWRQFLRSVGEYSAAGAGVTAGAGSRGVVLTTSDGWVGLTAVAVLQLRAVGCDLPIQVSYVRGQVGEDKLAWLRSFNVTTVDVWRRVARHNWGGQQWSWGAVKAAAVLESPFEQVLFLDPDVAVIHDPTYLFDSLTFRRRGALFWTDFMRRPADSLMWDVFDLRGRRGPSGANWDPEDRWTELESGQFLVDKSRVWAALRLTEHILAESKYYFDHFLGDKEAFFWGFAGSNTSVYVNPHYLHSVGVLAD